MAAPTTVAGQILRFAGTDGIAIEAGPLHNYGATAAPTANEDAGDGYDEGSLWVDVTANKVYVCVDATTTAAIWHQVDTLTALTDPNADRIVFWDDSAGAFAFLTPGTGLTITTTTIAASGGGGGFPAWIPGRYYDKRFSANSAVSTLVVTADRLYAIPIFVPETTDVDRIGINVTAFAGAFARLGLYDDDGANNLPSTLLYDEGTVATSTPNQVREITIARTLTSGWYWVAGVFDSTPTVSNTGSSTAATPIGTSTLAGGAMECVYMAHTFAALPATFSASPTYTTSAPLIALRAA